jgi:hypothetical protein
MCCCAMTVSAWPTSVRTSSPKAGLALDAPVATVVATAHVRGRARLTNEVRPAAARFAPIIPSALPETSSAAQDH